MAQKPIAMEQLKQILQLHNDGIGIREMARRVGMSRNSVRKYLSLLDKDKKLCDSELADQAYANNDLLQYDAERLKQLTLHFSTAGPELSKTGVTRQLLWQEYMTAHADGYSYSRYCYHLDQYLKNRDLSMHLECQPGEMVQNLQYPWKQQLQMISSIELYRHLTASVSHRATHYLTGSFFQFCGSKSSIFSAL